MTPQLHPPTGHVFRVERKRGPVWWAKYRLPDGRQIQKKLGPAWTDRDRPPLGYFTKRTAEAWLRDLLDASRDSAGARPYWSYVRRCCGRNLRYIEHDRGRKPSTVRGYRSAIEAHLLPAFANRTVLAGSGGRPATREEPVRFVAEQNARHACEQRRGCGSRRAAV